jgi:hypothetical protein
MQQPIMANAVQDRLQLQADLATLLADVRFWLISLKNYFKTIGTQD